MIQVQSYAVCFVSETYSQTRMTGYRLATLLTGVGE